MDVGGPTRANMGSHEWNKNLEIKSVFWGLMAKVTLSLKRIHL